MKERDYIINLYDFYEGLFNDIQKKYFESYYFNNLSLAEISENFLVSRSAISKVLKLMESKLHFYEDKLHLYDKKKKLNKIIEKIDDEELKKSLNKLS